MSRKKKIYEDDDGRSIADMNVDGMPWYDGRPQDQDRPKGPSGQQTELDRSTRGSALLGILAAIAVVTVIFAVIFLLVILGILLIGRHGLGRG
jgi:hypothetical protein